MRNNGTTRAAGRALSKQASGRARVFPLSGFALVPVLLKKFKSKRVTTT